MKRIFALALVAVSAVVAFSSPAEAASPADIDCDAYVVDQAGVMDSSQEATAEEAALDLQNVGADPRVVFIDSFGAAGSIDDFEQALVSRCDSWQSADGERKNNLVAVIVAIEERRAVLSWGERWDRSLEGQSDRIRADFLNPYLADGEFGQAVEATFGEIGDLLYAQLHPEENQGPTIINEAPDEPTDLTALWVILAVIGGLALLALIGFGAVRYRRFLIAREKAQGLARAARDAAVNAIADVSQAHDELARSVEIARLSLGAEDARELDRSYAEATAALGAASTAFAALGTADDPDKGRRIDEYEDIQARHENVTELAAQASASIAATSALAAELGRLARELPARNEALASAIAATAATRKETQEAGYRVDHADELAEEAFKRHEQAAKAIAGKRLRDAEESIAAGEALIAALTDWCRSLPELRARLERGAAELKTRLNTVEARGLEAKEVFEALASDYAEDAWEPVRGNGSEAEALFDAAQEAQAKATLDCGMERQEWVESEQALAEGDKALDQAEALLEAIFNLKTRLDEAKAAAGEEIAAADADIASAWEFVRANDADVPEALEVELREAEALLAEARRELEEAKPNYLLVVGGARKANETADAVLVNARSYAERLDSLRRKAATALREAERAVDTAEDYISSHSLDVDYSAESKLDEAKGLLARAKAVDTSPRSEETSERDQEEGLSEVVRLAEAAEQAADEALSEAEDDVRDARRRRDSYQSSLGSGAAYGGSSAFSGSSFGGSSFGGGGGGFSSGGFGGGGGGSSSGGW